MKKTFAILTMLLVAVCGFMFGCDADKYDKLKIQLSSPNLVGDVLTLYYGQETDLAATVSGVGGINKSVYFSCSDPDALQFTKVNNTEDGTTVVVKALKPTYDNTFTLQAKSVENNARYAEVKVKVILPIQGLDLLEKNGEMKNLAVSHSIPLNLFEQINFYPQTPYVTNQKSVVYSIINYGVNNPNDITIDNNGLLSVSANAIDNLVKLDPDNCLTIRVTSTDNTSIFNDIKVNVIRDIDISTVSYESSQISLNGEYDDKTNMVLFSNSELYYSETVSVTVQTGQEIDVTPIVTGDNNVIEVTHLAGEDSYTSINGLITTRTQKFKIRAKSIRGISYVNFKIKIKNIANDMEYLLTDDARITVDVSGLPRTIDLKQNGTSYGNYSTLIIYDSYQTTQTTMAYGAKIVVNVSSESNSAVDELNKYLRIQVLDGDKDVSSYFQFSDANGLEITPQNGAFTVLSNNAFYVKATSNSIGKTFTLKVTTIIDKFVEYVNGSASGVQSELVTNEYYLQSNYGVESIEPDQREYVLKLFTGQTAANVNKTKVHLTFNENADTSNMQFSYDDEFVIVEKLDTNNYLLTGIKVTDNTNVTFTASNGFSRTIRVKIVQEVTDVLIKVDNPINSQVITQTANNINGRLATVSAKAGGRFNVYSVVAPHTSGIVSYNYTSSVEQIATINSSGVVVTRSAGEAIIEVTATYYRFEVNAEGYLSVVEDTIVNNFVLTVFIPSSSIKLNQTVINVYSEDSLGFEYKAQSFIEIYALISPVTATIYSDESRVTYRLVGDNGNLVEVSRGMYQAFLPNGQTSATVMVVVTVDEYGTSTPLVCTVNITKAKQIKNISIDNVEKVQGRYVLNMRQDETHELAISYDPTDAYITEFKMVLIDYVTGEMYTDNNAVKLVTIDGHKIISSPGTYPTDEDNAGEIYLRIFAKDSMTGSLSGKVYVDIYINVTDGSVNNPYIISNANELARIGDAPTKHYVLGNDIDMSGVNLRPMSAFSGTLNGYYYIKGIDGAQDISRFNKIENLSIDATNANNVGMFQEITSTGALFNLHLVVAKLYVSGADTVANVGTFAGINNGLIMNCSVEIQDFIVESYDEILTSDVDYINVGGMVGQNKGYIFNFATSLGMSSEGSTLGLTTAELKDKEADYFADATFRTITQKYSTGAIINDDDGLVIYNMTINEFVASHMPYTNYVDGVMVIRDSRYQYINAGGMVGQNLHIISGVYGIYNRIDESSFQEGGNQEIIFTATVQNQGVDSSVTITPNGAELKNRSSTFGGIVGYMSNDPTSSNTSSIYNVSSSSNITGYNNVGGIVGKAEGASSRKVTISTALASGRISAYEYVGGAIGTLQQGIVGFIRVENYQNLSANGSNSLIEARNRVGGVIGSAQASNVSYIYSVTYVDSALGTYDIEVKNNDLEGYVGGLIGYSSGTTLTYSYSKLKLHAIVTVSSSIGGLVGFFDNGSKLSDCYFMGTVRAEVNATATSYYAQVIGEVGSTVAESDINYVYITGTTRFVGNRNWFTGSTTVVGTKTAAVSMATGRDNWELDSDNINNGYPILQYTVNARMSFEALFIKLIPTSMRVVVSSSIPEEVDAIKIDNSNMIIKYSGDDKDTHYNTYKITELCSVSVTPETIKQVSLIVTSSDPTIVKVTNNGELITMGTGRVTLTFVARLNTNITASVTIYVVQKVTSMQIYTNSNLTGAGLLYGTDDDGNPVINSVSVRKDGTQKLYPTFYCDDRVVYPDLDVNYVVDDTTYFEIVNNTIYGKAETENMSAMVRVVQTIEGIAQPIVYHGIAADADRNSGVILVEQSDLEFYVRVFSGATDISVTPNNTIQITKYVPQQLKFTLVTDSSVDYATVKLTDDQGYVYSPVLTTDADGTVTVSGISVFDRYGDQISDETLIEQLVGGLKISISNYYFLLDASNSYSANIAIEVRDGFEYTTTSSTYRLEIIAGSNELVNTSVAIEIVPQEMLHMDGAYYLFENLNNNSSGFVFSEKPSNAIIPGRFGIFKANTAPVYSGIENFYIQTIGSQGYVNYSQLVLDNVNSILVDGDGRLEVYRFAPSLYVQESDTIFRLLRLSNYLGSEVEVFNEYRVTPSIKEENGRTYIKVAEVYNSTTATYNITYEIYDFDGNLYVQMVSSSGLYVVDQFDINLIAEYGDGRTAIYTHNFVVNDLPTIEITTSRDYISIVNAGAANGDTITVSAALSDGLTGEVTISQYGYRGMIEPTDASQYYNIAVLSGGVLSLKHVEDDEGNVDTNQSAQLGDTIVIVATYSINVDGKIETITAKKYIKVVDVVLEDVEVSKVNIDNILSFTVSSTVELKANIIGYGESVEINNKSIEISRQLTTEGAQRISYWRYVRANGNTVNIDDGSLVLPFSINKTFVASDKAIISLIGSTQAGTVLMELAFYYYYTPNTEAGSGGVLMFTDNPESVQGAVFYFSKQFTVQVNADSNADRPIPIYTQSDLYGMAEGGNYILMADITIESHTPITTSIASLDGNNKIITIKNFNYDDNSGGSVTNAINLGLFDTIAENTIIKNVIVAYQNNQATPLNLANYLKINFGGIAAVNNGIITNCDVISVYPQQVNLSGVLVDSADLTDAVKYGLTDYTFNIQSSVQIDGTLVETHVGGFVGQNSSTGRITNSRVGRDSVNIVTPRDTNGTTYGEAEYAYTAPVTLMRVAGSGSIGGFAGANDGIISSCYFKNGQIEITTYGSTYTQVAGFVADNTGAVYGSYAAGWEEENFIDGDIVGGYLLSQSTNAEGNTQTVTSANSNASRRMGGGLYSNANIAGFVYSNGGVISNSYSALNLNGNPLFAANRDNITSSLQLTEYGNLNAGGFVFTNLKDARIETSYSISKLKSKITTHGAFVGIAPISGDVQNEGTVDKCYFLLEIGENIYDDYDPAYSISQSIELDLGSSAGGDNAVLNTNEFIETGSFSGFSFDNNNYSEGMISGAIWAMHVFEKSQEGSDVSSFGYPELISANSIATSLRVLRVDDANPTAYSYIYVQDFEKGSINNPQLITSAAEYNNLFTDILNSSSNIENVNVKYTGNIRLVTNIDFAGITVTSSSFEYSSLINSTSIFDGNNMYMYNLLLSDESATNTAFGLFKSLNSVGIKNLSLTINKVSSTNGVAVGGLAGVIVDSDINNINIVAATEGASVSGKNFVGGLAGIILSSEADNLHYANNIQSNVAVLASYTTESNPNFIKSGEIWSYIIPPAKIEGSVSSDNNLRLQYLPTNVSYAGGIAGVVDLLQAFESEGADDGSGARQSLSKVNVRSANVGNLELYTASLSEGVVLDNPVNIEAEFAGGLFGFIGQQTYFKEGYFLVYEASQSHYINSTVAAGGIAAINYGFIEQVHVSHDEDTQLDLDGYLQSLVSGTTNISRGNEALYTGKPTYLGGITGINIGSRFTNSGAIKNCYNRVDVKNIYATKVGGIVGATHIGSLTNVFTTATIMGDLTNRQTYLGQIIGQLLDNTNNSFFVETVVLDKGDSSYELELANVVAINAWNSADYDALKAFTDNFGFDYTDVYGNTTKVKIGAIYAPYHDKANSKYQSYEGYVKDFGKTGSSTFLLDKIYKGYNKNTDLDFISLYTGCETLTGERNNKLYYYVQQNPTNIITQDVYKDLMTVQAGVVSNAKQTIFTTTVWSDRVWLFDDTRALITLKFGYIPNVSRIYTAEEFLSIINEDPASSRTYVIMNDLDFSKENTNLTGQLINIGSNFRGKILGNTVKDENGNGERKPILFNLEIQSNGKSDTSLFTSTTNARFEGFNIVLSEYIENYKPDEQTGNAVNTRSSILLGNATNTVVNNIHIYSNIHHIANSDYLKLRIKDSDEDYYYTYSINDDVEDNADYFVYQGSGNNKNVIKNDADYPIETSANYFGGFVANGNSMTIIQSSFNINIRSVYDSSILPTGEGSAIYFGGIAGRYLGTISNTRITSNIDFAGDGSASNASGVEMMYIGGVVGYLSGTLEEGVNYEANSFNVDADGELLFNIGSDNNYVSNTSNIYIGGIAGSAQKLNSADSDLISKVENVSVKNVEIVAYLASTASIGGVIGINEWEASSLTYKNDNTAVNAYNYSDPGTVIESGEEQDLSVYTSTKANINIGGVIGSNTYSQLTGLKTNANIYFKDNSAYSTASHKVNIGGIIGSTYAVVLLNAVQEGHTILADSAGGDFTGIGGLIGAIDDAVSANELEIMFSITTVDIVVKGSDTSVVAGGFIGNAEPSVLSMTSSIVYSTVSILSRKVNESNAKALVYGGVAGKVKEYVPPAGTSNGTVVAVTLYYPDIANIEVTSGLVEYSIGQLFGVVTEISTTNAYIPFDGLYYNETLFAMYINKYYNYTINGETGSIDKNNSQAIIDKETKDFIYENAKLGNEVEKLISLSERVNLVISHANAQNLLSTNISNSLEQKAEVYSRLAQYIQVASGVFSQVSGTKLNPIKVTGSGVSFEAHKHYELIADYTISSPITLNKGVFLRANGFTIKCSNSTNYVFESIGEYAVVSGLLVESANITNTGTDASNPVGILAKTNNGMIISCGTSGTISGKYVSGLVGTNKGIIIDSFTIAAVTATSDGAAAGFVVKNEGSVISCHATGLISSTSAGSASGFVNSNTGKIASCYTVSNVFGGENSYDNIYAFVKDNNNGVLKYNYYDENAYTGDHKAADNDTRYAPTQTSKLTNIYAMNDSGEMVKNLSINGNWYENSYPNRVIQNSTLASKFTSDMTNTWFNYGYGLINSDYTIGSYIGKARLLNMLYTGNGKQEGTGTTNGFDNSPYQITNAGIFEAFVLGDHAKGVKSYYILMNDISFAAYDNWSDSWDENGVFFRGDFDGNNKTLKDLNSKHGLFRVFADEAYAYDFTITEAYSQTGILAAYMTSDGDVAKIKNVTIKTTKLEGKTENVSNTNIAKFNPSPTIDGVVAFNDHFAGGLVGYMAGGVLDDVDIVEVDDEAFIIKNARDDGYVGGYVGYYTGGVIKPTDKTNVFKNAAAIIVQGPKAGAYIGYAYGFEDNGLVVESNANVTGYDTAAGFIAEAAGCELTNCSSKAIVDGTTTSAGFVGHLKDSTLTTCKYLAVGVIIADSYAGGLVGTSIDSTIKNCEVNTTKNITSSEYAGGIVAHAIDTTITYDNATAANPVTVDTISATRGAGGLVGGMAGTTITGTSSNVLTSDNKVTNNSGHNAGTYVGGIVGRIYAISTTENSNANNTSSTITYVNNTGAISNTSVAKSTCPNIYIGGLVGGATQTTTISNSNNNGTFSIPNDSSTTIAAIDAGGVIGYVDGTDVLVKLLTVTNTASMSGFVKNMGGIAGNFTQSSEDDNTFDNVTNSGTINNTNTNKHVISNGEITTAGSTVGGIIGYATGAKINNANNYGAVTGVNAGGIVSAIKNGIIKASTNNSAISGSTYAGGIAATAQGTTIESCVNASTGTINSSAGTAGGIVAVGRDYTFASTVTNNADVTGKDTAGGVVGYSYNLTKYKTLENKGTTISGEGKVGGVFGQFIGGKITSTGTLSISSTASSVKGTSGSSRVGGIIGEILSGSIETATAMTISDLTLSGFNVGGFIGYLSATEGDIVLSEIKLSNNITFDNSGREIYYTGGIVGYAAKGRYSVSLTKLETANNKTITAKPGSEGTCIGGIIGKANSGITMDSCLSRIAINIETALATGQLHIGGHVGYADTATITNATTKNVISLGTMTTAAYKTGMIVGSSINSDIKNATIESGASITGTIDNTKNSYIGGVAGYLKGGAIELENSNANVGTTNIKLNPTISVNACVGGVVGFADASSQYAIKSTNKTYKIAGSLTGYYVGGIVGYSTSDKGSEIDNFNVSLTTISGSNAGGVIGLASGGVEITNCHVNVTYLEAPDVDGDKHVGGMVGFSEAELTISSCKITSQVRGGNAQYAGGLVGYAKTKPISISNNSVEHSVTGSSYAGGILGGVNINGTVSDNTITTANKVIDADNAGGIIGHFQTGASELSVSGNKVQNQTIGSYYAGAAGAVVGEFVGSLVASGGGVFGDTYSEYKDCKLDGSAGGFFAGKLTGGSSQARSFSVSTSQFTGFNIDTNYFGTVAGYISGTYSQITCTYVLSAANISDISSSCYLGGIIGLLDSSSTLGNSTAATGSKISSIETISVGGVIGYASSAPEVKNCYSDANIDVKAYEVGGICGYSYNTTFSGCTTVDNGEAIITKDYSGGNTAFAGGIVGYLAGGSVTSCTNYKLVAATASTITNNHAYAGGIVGYAGGATISSCTNTGAVTAKTRSSSTYEKHSGITSGTVYTSSYDYYAYAGGIAGRVYNTTVSSNTNSATSINGSYDIKTDSGYNSRSTFEWATFESWQDKIIFGIPTTIHYKVNLRFKCTTGGIVGYDESSTFSGNKTSENVPYHSYTRGRGIIWSGYSEDSWLWDWFRPDKVYNELYNSHLEYMKSQITHSI